MSDFLTPADIEAILGDRRWPRPAGDQDTKARCAAQPQALAETVCHEINFRGGRRWMTDERRGRAAWWRFWE